MKGTFQLEFVGQLAEIVDGIDALQSARFAARYEPRYSLSDQAEDEAIIVVEAHE